MRRDCKPHLVDKDGKSLGLTRIDFGDRSIGENFLQEELHKCPSILPISELDDSFAPIISLGREIRSIDNLFISPTGRLSVVETKLWRNPQATREVVAQIVNYAQQLGTMSYDEFEKACRSALQPAPLANKTLYEFVKSAFPDEAPDEPDFIDAVQRNLKNYRFLLLVVGDGIRENIEDMVNLLNPNMLFTFGLVEMQVYENNALPGRLIIPHLVAHTKEIVRAVVRIEGQKDVNVSVVLADETERKATTLTEQEFLDAVKDKNVADLFRDLLAFAKDLETFKSLRFAAKSVKPTITYGEKGHFSLFRLYLWPLIGVNGLAHGILRYGLDQQIAWDFVASLAKLFPGVTVRNDKPRLSRTLRPREVSEHLVEFKQIIRETVDKISATPVPESVKNTRDEKEEDVEELSANDMEDG